MRFKRYLPTLNVIVTLRCAVVAVLVVAGLVSFGSAASAAGGEQGKLRIKGPGSVYAGSKAWVTKSVAAGSAATYSFQVKNTGAATAQYNIRYRYNGSNCAGPCAEPTVQVNAGSLLVTKLAQGPNGYFTAPIEPSKLATYSLKITPQTGTTTPGDTFFGEVDLYDTAGNLLDVEYTRTSVRRSTGTGPADQFVSASGTQPTSGNASSGAIPVTTPSVAVGGTAKWTVKLMNNTATPTQISYRKVSAVPLGCAQYLPLTIKQGTVDVTTAVNNNLYKTKSLAKGQSVALTVSVKHLAGATACLAGTSSHYWVFTASSGGANSGSSSMILVFNVPAT